MLPELIQATCTALGVWGPATEGNKLYHMRALDWEPLAQVNQYPAIVMYQPTEAGSHNVANIGYLGLIGSLTAISKHGISAGEKVMYVDDPTAYPVNPVSITYFGKPWMFVLRDTVQFSNNMDDVMNTLRNTNRTMKLHLGWGSLPDNKFVGMHYAYNLLQTFDDKNYTHNDETNHPQLDGTFYFDKMIQPSDNTCIGNILKDTHGRITPETLYQEIAGRHTTGDATVVVMDPEGQQVWVSWSEYNTTTCAY